MQRGERDLRGPGQVEVIVGEAVDLLLGVGQEAGPVERLLAHERGRDHGLEAKRAQPLERPADERELEQDEVALEVGEARARRAAPPPPCRSSGRPARGGRAPARSRLADAAHDGVLVGGVVRGQVRHRAQLRAPGRPRRRRGAARARAPPRRAPAPSRSPPRRRRRRAARPRSRRRRGASRRAATRARAGSRAAGRRARGRRRGRSRAPRRGVRAPPARPPAPRGSA